MNKYAIPSSLIQAREYVKSIQVISVVTEWQCMFDNYWGFAFTVNLANSPSQWIAKKTKWFILAEESYPNGSVMVLPAKKGGIDATFPHQEYNDNGDGNFYGKYPVRTGKLCLDHPYAPFDKYAKYEEPHDLKNRLQWYILRTVEWVNAAANNLLTKAGEPFELPQPPKYLNALSQIIFNEDPQSFEFWQILETNSGQVNFKSLPNGTESLIVSSFQDFNGNVIHKTDWGTFASNLKENIRGIWIKLDKIPIDPPWAFPHRWEDLYSRTLSANLILKDILDEHSKTFRAQEFLPVIIGFPVPERFEEDNVQYHWAGLLISDLHSRKKKINGFRNINEKTLLSLDKQKLRHPKKAVPWIKTINSHKSQLLTRGGLPTSIKDKQAILIGCGALGSMVANSLAKSGFTFSHLFDKDQIDPGNTVRHTLGFNAVQKNKAEELADHLNRSNSWNKTIGIASHFPNMDTRTSEYISKNTDVIIECTAEDQLLSELKSYEWPRQREFISLSFGFGATRMYAYYVKDISFPVEEYRKLYTPWKKIETEASEQHEMPWEGIGCWHPVFPARVDDVSLWASMACKFIEQALLSSYDMHFTVWEIQTRDGMPEISMIENRNE